MAASNKKKLTPVLDGESWLIGPNPRDLGPLQGEIIPGRPFAGQEVVDHHVWKDRNGVWRAWACVRHTAVGRVFYGWEAKSLAEAPWRSTGVMMRRDQKYGESLADRGAPGAHKEWIQSPYVIQHDGRYHMFYGGECYDALGKILISTMCLATSDDGAVFTRHLNDKEESWVFMGPGEARDPSLIRIGGLWFLYYSGAETGTSAPNKFYVRTSANLVDWSASREVHWGGSPGALAYQCECPHVVERGGYYYLFRTQDYAAAATFVYRSDDPYDFGLDSDKCLIGTIAVAAPEIVVEGGREYITSNHDLWGGLRMFPLRWDEV